MRKAIGKVCKHSPCLHGPGMQDHMSMFVPFPYAWHAVQVCHQQDEVTWVWLHLSGMTCDVRSHLGICMFHAGGVRQG